MALAYLEDCNELLSHIKEQEKILSLKRRWLMDLPLSDKQMKKLSPLTDKAIPEIFLREDDAYFSAIRSSVQRVLGVSHAMKEDQIEKDVQSFYLNYILKNLSSLLDKMTDKGLHCFAELLTDGLNEFEKTRRKIKRMIKKDLPIYLNEQNCNFQARMKEILSLLKDHGNFTENHDIFGSSTEYQVAAIRLLGGLEDLPLQTLRAMRRKLNGESGHIPELGFYKHEQKRYIIGPVKNCCMAMLSELHEGEELPEPLVKALAVASLAIKLVLGHPCVPEFRKFPPQIESLQNAIARAICVVSSGYKVNSSEIDILFKKLPHLEGSEVKFSKKKKRTSMSNMLMDFLYECSDMEIIPESLLDVVSYINKKSHDSDHGSVLMDKVEEEVELLLSFSAQIKQIVWDLVPGLEVDKDFANACMEDFEESDDDEEGVHLCQSHELSCDESKSSSESFGETIPLSPRLFMSPGTIDDFPLALSPDSLLKSKLQSVHITEGDLFQPYDFNLSSWPESEVLEKKHIFNGNVHQLASIKMHKQFDVCSFVSTTSQDGSSVPLSPGRIKECHDVKKEEIVYNSTRNAEVLHPSSPTRDPGSLKQELHSNENKYLSVQKACDDTSMAMYHIIGGMLAELAETQDLRLSHDDLAYLQGHC